MNSTVCAINNTLRSNRTCDTSSALNVHWTVSGTATPGIDYVELGNSVTIEAGSESAEVDVQLYNQAVIEPPYETAILTLAPDPNYWINARYNTATVKICENLFECAVSGLGGPIGIDYYPVDGNHALLISDNLWNYGQPWNFTKIFEVDEIPQCVNWSSISGLCDEIKVTTVKQSVANFLLGDMFFGHKPPNDREWTRIGRIAAGGTSWDTNWAILPGETSPVHGGLYMDQTGLFNYDLIVVTGGAPGEGGTVWRITSNPDQSSGQKTLFKTIPGAHLEGVITLPNEPVKYGPWAGKIVTGDESHEDELSRKDPVIYTIDQQGLVEEFHLRVAPEDFDIIQDGQNLYCNDATSRVIWGVPSWYFAEHVGDILVTQAGEINSEHILEGGQSLLLILHWDAEQNRFVPKVIFHPSGIMIGFEHVTFAPIDLCGFNN